MGEVQETQDYRVILELKEKKDFLVGMELMESREKRDSQDNQVQG